MAPASEKAPGGRRDLRELAPAERPQRPAEDEQIEVVAWPLADLDALIDQVRDAKSLIGLLRLARELRG